MSQGQPRRPEGGDALQQQQQDRPVRYGDVFDVSGDLAAQPVAPRDAALLQSAENTVQGLGQTQKGGPAAVMQSAATLNARAGHVGRGQVSGPVADAGVAVTETELPGRRVVTESVAGQVVGRFVAPPPVAAREPSGALEQDAVTQCSAFRFAKICRPTQRFGNFEKKTKFRKNIQNFRSNTNALVLNLSSEFFENFANFERNFERISNEI
uniref:Uncharacterized protein n=1 Tax=Avena sativa TaxID=4498 RepID=A0ACD5X734_AVESA